MFVARAHVVPKLPPSPAHQGRGGKLALLPIVAGVAVLFFFPACAQLWGFDDLDNATLVLDGGGLGGAGGIGLPGARGGSSGREGGPVAGAGGAMSTGGASNTGGGTSSSNDVEGGTLGGGHPFDDSGSAGSDIDGDVLNDRSMAAERTGDEPAPDVAASDASATGDETITNSAGTIVFSDDFESDPVAAEAEQIGWHRYGGSMADWQVFEDTSNVLRQFATSATFRICYGGPSTSGPASVTAQVKVVASVSSAMSSASLCVRYNAVTHAFDCLAFRPGIGLQVMASGELGPVWTTTTPIELDAWYNLKLSIDASGVLTAYWNDIVVGTFLPANALVSGFAAVATASAIAEFDNIVLTTP